MKVTTTIAVSKDDIEMDVGSRMQLATAAYIDFGLQLKSTLDLPEGGDCGCALAALVAFYDHNGGGKMSIAAHVAQSIISSPDLGGMYEDAVERVNKAEQEQASHAERKH